MLMFFQSSPIFMSFVAASPSIPGKFDITADWVFTKVSKPLFLSLVLIYDEHCNTITSKPHTVSCCLCSS